MTFSKSNNRTVVKWNIKLYSKKCYMIDTFSFIQILNPKKMNNFKKCMFFWQIFEVWCFDQSSNLTFVETFWWHEFIEEFLHFATEIRLKTGWARTGSPHPDPQQPGGGLSERSGAIALTVALHSAENLRRMMQILFCLWIPVFPRAPTH